MNEITQLFGIENSHNVVDCEMFYQHKLEMLLKKYSPEIRNLRLQNPNYRESEIYQVVKEWGENQTAEFLYFRLTALFVAQTKQNTLPLLGMVESITNC